MAPTLRHGDQLLVWFGTARLRPGQVAVVDLPQRPLSVKRLVRREADGWWVEGDNPFASTDSRVLGPVAETAVRGVVLLRLWPRPGRVARPGCQQHRGL
jgi:nickel-type superoxide dismutase maturation protease